MSHIVIDARSINSSTGTYIERLLHYLEAIKTPHRYTILVPTKDLLFWQPRYAHIQVIAADFDDYSLAEQTSYVSFLRRLDADLIHFTMPQQPILYNRPSVTTIHDLTLLRVYNSDKNFVYFKAKQFIGRFVFWRVARKSAAIITPTEFTKKDVMQFAHIPGERIHVTYEAADIGQFELEEYTVPYKQFLINVGRHSDYKNIPRLAQAHQKLLKKYPDLGLVLVNPKDEAVKMNEALFKKRGYKNIHFTDTITKGQRDYLYTKASAYVFPTLHEGFGLGALEAMGHGVPVLSSNASCLPEVYQDGVNYFDPLDVDTMAKAIDHILTDARARQDLIRRGKARHGSFSWKRMAEQTYAVYETILARQTK